MPDSLLDSGFSDGATVMTADNSSADNTPVEVSQEDSSNSTPADVVTHFRTEIATSKKYKKSLLPRWKRNVEMRLGRNGTSTNDSIMMGDETRPEINPDWQLTKAKTANLYSQVPQVQVTHENNKYKQAIPGFMKSINYEIGEKRANLGVPMEEVLNDTVNASGIGAILVGYAARFEETQVPAEDVSHLPEQSVQDMIAAGQLKMVTAYNQKSYKFFGKRISPADLLWASSFKGSDFNEADWVGYTDQCSWSEAKHAFKLKDSQKELAVTEEKPKDDEGLRSEPERDAVIGFEQVTYDEIFYWRYKVDPLETSFKAIWHMVFVRGINKPVLDELWNGQQFVQETGEYVGACFYPLQFLTLTYVTDNPIVPSDTEAGRSQVLDLRRSRRQLFDQRDRNRPMRWYDVNRVDVEVQAQIESGEWQVAIPSNGDGNKSFGEVVRASFPAEDLTFDQRTMEDLRESWSMGAQQMGVTPPGERTKGEIEVTQQNFTTRMGQERARVASFFLRIVEVMAGFMALYSDFPVLDDQEKQLMQNSWDGRRILHDLAFKIRPNATIALDSTQRMQQLGQFLNETIKSGYINPKPIIEEMAELANVDPTGVLIDPQPAKPAEPSISIRFTGKEDLYNPAVMALLVKYDQAPSPENMNTAKAILAAAQTPEPTQPPQPPVGGPSGAPGQPPTEQNPQTPPDAHPNWGLNSKIAQRAEDIK